MGMLQASDEEIWRHAGATAAAVVTKDEDFATLLSVRPNGAAVIWGRVDNTSRQHCWHGLPNCCLKSKRH